uniref:PID domain-containing protein n=1 Tax=Scleropages formosus TaxID=113540 RepID=A0A8C9S6I5_SCLFO
MSDVYEQDVEIAFTVKFLGRTEVLRPDGLQLLYDAAEALKEGMSNKGKKKKHKVSLFMSVNGVDILEHETKFLLYTCPLSTISYCAVHQTMPHIFGFVAQHPVADMYHCYLFQSKKFSLPGNTGRKARGGGDTPRTGRQSVARHTKRDSNPRPTGEQDPVQSTAPPRPL